MESQEQVAPESNIKLNNSVSDKKYKIAIVALAILAIGGFTFGGIELYQKTNETTQTVNNGSTSLDDIFNSYINGSTLGDVVYKPEKSDIPILLQKKTLGGSISVDSDKAVDLLTRNGFSKEGDYSFVWAEEVNETTYVKDDILCTYSGLLTCALKREFPDTDESYDIINGVAKAYEVKTGEKPSIIVYNNGQILYPERGGVAPYQTLSVSFGDGQSLFYRKDSSAEWEYFATKQAPLNCSDYNTEDAKKAFLGDFCYGDNMEESVVSY